MFLSTSYTDTAKSSSESLPIIKIITPNTVLLLINFMIIIILHLLSFNSFNTFYVFIIYSSLFSFITFSMLDKININIMYMGYHNS